MITKPYTCTLLPEVTRDDPPRLGVRSNETGVIAAFWEEDARRLFLAAPDLLAALTDLCEKLPPSAVYGSAKVAKAYDAAQTAIAKATGRSV